MQISRRVGCQSRKKRVAIEELPGNGAYGSQSEANSHLRSIDLCARVFLGTPCFGRDTLIWVAGFWYGADFCS